jgi:hypothetical protein
VVRLKNRKIWELKAGVSLTSQGSAQLSLSLSFKISFLRSDTITYSHTRKISKTRELAPLGLLFSLDKDCVLSSLGTRSFTLGLLFSLVKATVLSFLPGDSTEGLL